MNCIMNANRSLFFTSLPYCVFDIFFVQNCTPIHSSYPIYPNQILIAQKVHPKIEKLQQNTNLQQNNV